MSIERRHARSSLHSRRPLSRCRFNNRIGSGNSGSIRRSGRSPGSEVHRRDHIFGEYLENEEAYIRTPAWKYVFCSGQRERTDGYKTANPTPGRYRRLYDLKKDPGEFTDVASKHPQLVEQFENLMLVRFRSTHPNREMETERLSRAEAIEFYLPPRDPARRMG